MIQEQSDFQLNIVELKRESKDYEHKSIVFVRDNLLINAEKMVVGGHTQYSLKYINLFDTEEDDEDDEFDWLLEDEEEDKDGEYSEETELLLMIGIMEMM
jgi:hypothetical protein